MIKSIPQIMYEYAEAKDGKVIDRISPSQIGRCMRAHYYEIMHLPHTTRPNPGALLNFQTGFLWEEVMEKAILHSKTPMMYQLGLSDEQMYMEGTLDFAIYDKDKDWWEIWDSKTEATAAGIYRRKRKGTFFGDHPEYVHQLNAYCLLMRNYGFRVGAGRFGIISKDNGSISEETTDFPESSLRATLERIMTLKGYIERQEVPPCECEGWRVGYCSYGRPSTRARNSTRKWVNTECCGSKDQIKKWAKEPLAEKVEGV